LVEAEPGAASGMREWDKAAGAGKYGGRVGGEPSGIARSLSALQAACRVRMPPADTKDHYFVSAL